MNELKAQKYISIDLETTDLDIDNAQVLEFCAVVEDWQTEDVKDLPYFHCYFYHKKLQGSYQALKLNRDLLDKIHDIYDTPTKHRIYTDNSTTMFIRHLNIFLRNNDINTKSINNLLVAGKNFATYDKLILDRLFNFTKDFGVHRRILDPAILYFDPAQDAWLPSTSVCLERAGLDPELKHDAYEDACNVIRLIRNKLRKV